jgi:hypothetical protein
MLALPAALAGMAAYRQFILYKLVPGPVKTQKFPCDFRTGQVVSAHDPQYWTDAQTAIAACANYGSNYGVGFTFTNQDPFWFLDIDNCLQADNTWSPLAISLCNYFSGCAVEVSQSGKGLHIFGSGKAPTHGCKNVALGLEFYHADRFVALTGSGAMGSCGFSADHLLPGLVSTYFDSGNQEASGSDGWTEGPCEGWNGPTDDEELIRRAIRSKSVNAAFGNKASFQDLWEGNVEALARTYPDELRGYDSSSADAALAQHLAFWTGCDCARIERLMLKSGLVRDKFDRADYLPRTISNAVARQVDILTDKMLVEVESTAAGGQPVPKLVEGTTFANADDQLRLFAGCVYVTDIHRVFVPGGSMLKPDQFRVRYGGYQFTMDSANEKTTKDPWEAFTMSQSFRCPRVDSCWFKPNLVPGSIGERAGKTYVNTYWPVDVPRKVGDGTPFFNHLAKVLPDERDRQILLCYMAACVQHKGIKFQWAPLLQGVEGNGKTLFTRCVAEAIGDRYVHFPKASKLAKEFNSWLVGKLFYGVEDIYVPDHKREVIEELKPMITGENLEIEGKGVDQINAWVCGNFIFNSNHKDAIRKTKNDRRFAVFFTAQQEAADLRRDGMSDGYFNNLYEWLRSEGYAIVTELLCTYPIPDEFNPAGGCMRAPQTSSTTMAINASLGAIEQEIKEAIDMGVPGFLGGFISSIQLNLLLERIGAARRLSHNKRKDMLHDMGYEYHPALVDGRVNNTVRPDNGKPRLFVHKDAPARGIAVAADVAREYEKSNDVIAERVFG